MNSVSVARWTKASIWREKKAQIFVRGYNLLRCEQLFRGGVLSLPLRWIVVHYFLVFSLVSNYRNVSKSFRLISKKLYNHSQHFISCQKLFGWVRAPLLGKYRCIIFARSLQHDFSCTISETFWDSGLIYDFIKQTNVWQAETKSHHSMHAAGIIAINKLDVKVNTSQLNLFQTNTCLDP